jgi:hypothetical protein
VRSAIASTSTIGSQCAAMAAIDVTQPMPDDRFATINKVPLRGGVTKTSVVAAVFDQPAPTGTWRQPAEADPRRG